MPVGAIMGVERLLAVHPEHWQPRSQPSFGLRRRRHSLPEVISWSGAGQPFELLERLSVEQRLARHFARATRLGADCAMTMMLRVPSALFGANRAPAHAGLQQPVNDDVIRPGRSREDPRHEIADLSAIPTERDARAHLRHVGLYEIRVRAGRARLDAVQASVDRRRDLRDSERHAARRGIQHLASVRHATRTSSAARGRSPKPDHATPAGYWSRPPSSTAAHRRSATLSRAAKAARTPA